MPVWEMGRVMYTASQSALKGYRLTVVFSDCVTSATFS